MKHLIIISILLLTISLTAIETDKIAHFLVSAGIYDVTFNYLDTTYLSHDTCEGIAFYSALFVGIGKETYDEYYGTGFSGNDMFANIMGITVALGFNRWIDHLEYKRIMIDLNRNRIGVRYKF